jgi:hypothetical protein
MSEPADESFKNIATNEGKTCTALNDFLKLKTVKTKHNHPIVVAT